MFSMSPDQMHRQVVRSQDETRRQLALERQAVKAHRADAVPATGTRDTVHTALAAARRVIASLHPRTVRHATVR